MVEENATIHLLNGRAARPPLGRDISGWDGGGSGGYHAPVPLKAARHVVLQGVWCAVSHLHILGGVEVVTEAATVHLLDGARCLYTSWTGYI